MNTSEMSGSQGSKDQIREALRTMKKEVEKITKDVAAATEEVVESTRKAVREYSPKVAATLDETVKDTSAPFRKAMVSISSQTRPQQVKFLKGYMSLLSKQSDLVERRLKKLTK